MNQIILLALCWWSSVYEIVLAKSNDFCFLILVNGDVFLQNLSFRKLSCMLISKHFEVLS